MRMHPLIQEASTSHTPESLAGQFQSEPGAVLLRSALFDYAQARYSFVAARPFLRFRSFGSRCELISTEDSHVQFGNPWHILDALMARYELLDELDLPFPLGGCFGYWGYDLKNFVEPKLSRRAVNDLDLPDCDVGFYDSLAVFDHRLEKTWIISTGLNLDGTRRESKAQAQLEFWLAHLNANLTHHASLTNSSLPMNLNEAPLTPSDGERVPGGRVRGALEGARVQGASDCRRVLTSNISRSTFIALVDQAQRYIRAGDIYQVNLSHRLAAACPWSGLSAVGRTLARPLLCLPELWRFSDCLVVSRTFSPVERAAHSNAAHQRHTPALSRSKSRRTIQL
jgi:para-aminobenzoate synthetase component 1